MCSSEMKISIYIFPRWALLFQTSNPLQFLSQQVLVIPPTPTLWNFRDFPTWLKRIFPSNISSVSNTYWFSGFFTIVVIDSLILLQTTRSLSFFLGPSTKTLETQITTSVTEGARHRHEKRVFFSGCRPHFSRLASARVHSPH